MAANDYWGIVGRSTEDNQGILEIYTGDDGGSSTYNEIVKFSQYAGARTVESKPVKEFVVFDKSGNTSIPGVVSMGSTLTLRGNRGNADVFTDFNGGRVSSTNWACGTTELRTILREIHDIIYIMPAIWV